MDEGVGGTGGGVVNRDGTDKLMVGLRKRKV